MQFFKNLFPSLVAINIVLGEQANETTEDPEQTTEEPAETTEEPLTTPELSTTQSPVPATQPDVPSKRREYQDIWEKNSLGETQTPIWDDATFSIYSQCGLECTKIWNADDTVVKILQRHDDIPVCACNFGGVHTTESLSSEKEEIEIPGGYKQHEKYIGEVKLIDIQLHFATKREGNCNTELKKCGDECLVDIHELQDQSNGVNGYPIVWIEEENGQCDILGHCVLSGLSPLECTNPKEYDEDVPKYFEESLQWMIENYEKVEKKEASHEIGSKYKSLLKPLEKALNAFLAESYHVGVSWFPDVDAIRAVFGWTQEKLCSKYPFFFGCSSVVLTGEEKVLQENCSPLSFGVLFHQGTVGERQRRLATEVSYCSGIANNDPEDNDSLKSIKELLLSMLKDAMSTATSAAEGETSSSDGEISTWSDESGAYPMEAIFRLDHLPSVFAPSEEAVEGVSIQSKWASIGNRALYVVFSALSEADSYEDIPTILARKNMSVFVQTNFFKVFFEEVQKLNLEISLPNLIESLAIALKLYPGRAGDSEGTLGDGEEDNSGGGSSPNSPSGNPNELVILIGKSKKVTEGKSWINKIPLPGGKFELQATSTEYHTVETTHFLKLTKSMSDFCATVKAPEGTLVQTTYQGQTMYEEIAPINVAHGASGYFSQLERKLYGVEIPNMHFIGDIIVQPGCKFTAEDPKHETIETSYTYSVLSYTVTPISMCGFVGLQISTTEVQVTETSIQKVLLPRKFSCECYETVTISYIQVQKAYTDVLTNFEILELPQPIYIIIWVMGLKGTETIELTTDGSVSTKYTFGLCWKQLKVEIQDTTLGLTLRASPLGGFLFFTSSAKNGQLTDGPNSCGPCSGVSQGFFILINNATAPIDVHFQIEYMTTSEVVQNENMNGAYLTDSTDEVDPLGLVGAVEDNQKALLQDNSSSLALFWAALLF